MTENQSVIDRLKLFIKSKNLGQTKFEEICGLGRGWVSKIKGAPKDDKLLNIIQYFPDLNTVWLLTGEGEMLRVDATASGTEGETKEGVVMVPLLNLDARGGLSANEVTDTAEFVSGQIPFGADLARKGDFAMMITGDSMYPRYPSGSYILLREIPMWREYLELSVPYLLELQDERRVAKIVCKGSDREHYVLKSVNPDFEDTEISVSFIRRVFQVVAMLKKEIV